MSNPPDISARIVISFREYTHLKSLEEKCAKGELQPRKEEKEEEKVVDAQELEGEGSGLAFLPAPRAQEEKPLLPFSAKTPVLVKQDATPAPSLPNAAEEPTFNPVVSPSDNSAQDGATATNVDWWFLGYP